MSSPADRAPRFDEPTREPTLRVLSLGAGRQSTALYLLCVDGEFGDERPTVAIFADTGDEPQATYDHLARLEADFGHVLPIRRVGLGYSLSAVAYTSIGGRKRWPSMPLHVRNKDGEQAMLHRQCTREFKVEPIEKEIRRQLGVAKGRRVPKGTLVESWQGISRDEATRMKDNPRPWIRNRYPLVFDRPMTARDCASYNESRGYHAPKSACVFCPYTDNSRWRDMKLNRPDEFQRAVAFDRRVRTGLKGVTQTAYVHRSLQPLDEVDFSSAEDLGQVNMFENECEGLCGV